MSSISGRHDGRRILLDVAIVGASFDMAQAFSGEYDAVAPILSEPVKALVDTGATSTSISLQTARKLKLISAGKRDMMTANGPRRARFRNFRVAMIASPLSQYDATTTPFFVLPNAVSGTELNPSEFAFDILLGMDVLSQGDLTIRRDGSFTFEF